MRIEAEAIGFGLDDERCRGNGCVMVNDDWMND